MTRAILIPASLYPDSGYVVRTAVTAPDRFRAVIGVDPRDRRAAEQIEIYAALGAAGIRLTPEHEWITRRVMATIDHLTSQAAGAGLAIQWTVGLKAAHLIERVAIRVPKARQVLDHLGLPEDVRDPSALHLVRDLAEIPQLRVKLSGMYAISRTRYPYEDTWPWIESVVGAFGIDRTMWGSDWPLSTESVSYENQLALVGLLPFLDVVARQAVLIGTAEQFWFDPSRLVRPSAAGAVT